MYPKGTRIDSSNYNPLIGWTHGAQMVAFNMQVCLFSCLILSDRDFLILLFLFSFDKHGVMVRPYVLKFSRIIMS